MVEALLKVGYLTEPMSVLADPQDLFIPFLVLSVPSHQSVGLLIESTCTLHFPLRFGGGDIGQQFPVLVSESKYVAFVGGKGGSFGFAGTHGA